MPRANETTLVEQANAELDALMNGGEQSEQPSHVELKLRKTDGQQQVVDAISQANPGAEIEEADDHFSIRAPHIRILRQEVEKAAGTKLSDVRWKSLFVNRSGDIKEFNEHEFSMGITVPVVEEEEVQIETIQFNVRIPKELKSEMDNVRALLGTPSSPMTQNSYVAEALQVLNKQIMKEIIG